MVPYRFPDPDAKGDQRPDDAQRPEVLSSGLDGSEKEEKEKKKKNRVKPSQKLLIADRQVYRIYFGSIGPTHLVIFFAFGVAFAFTLRFPGSSTPVLATRGAFFAFLTGSSINSRLGAMVVRGRIQSGVAGTRHRVLDWCLCFPERAATSRYRFLGRVGFVTYIHPVVHS